MCEAFVCDAFSGNRTVHAHDDCLSDCHAAPQSCEDAFHMFDAVGGCATDRNHSIVEGILQELDCATSSTFPGSTCVDKPARTALVFVMTWRRAL